jgi:hypothetical protein
MKDSPKIYTDFVPNPVTPRGPKEIEAHIRYTGRRMSRLLTLSRKGPFHNLRLSAAQLKVLWTAMSAYKNYSALSEEFGVVIDVFAIIHNALQQAEGEKKRVRRMP